MQRHAALLKKAEFLYRHPDGMSEHALRTYMVAFRLATQRRLEAVAENAKVHIGNDEQLSNAYLDAIRIATELYTTSGDGAFFAMAFRIAENSRSMVLLEEIRSRMPG